MSVTQPSHVLLDSVAGWRAQTTALGSTPDGSLRIDTLPGRAEPIPLAVGCVSAVATDACERMLLWIDALDQKVRWTALDELRKTSGQRAVHVLPAIGGDGTSSRRLRNARGIAMLDDGSIAVADTHNQRVQIFGPAPHPLLAVIQDGLQRPWGLVADPCGYLYVVDRGRGRLRRYFRDGTGALTVSEELRSPTAIARAEDGTLAVLDRGTIILVRNGATERLDAIDGASAVAFGPASHLFVGAGSLIYRFVPGPGGSLNYRNAGAGVTGREFAIEHLLWTKTHGLLVSGRTPCAPRSSVWRVDTDGAAAMEGSLVTASIDSGIDECRWDCIEIRGEIPEGCALRVETQTAESDVWSEGKPPRESPRTLVLRGGQLDSLVQSPPGRHLRLKLTLSGNGMTSPRVDAIRIRFPRDSYLKYLPAIYQEDPDSRAFLDRFLSIFQRSFDHFDETIDRISRLFDPVAVEDKHFAWLAGWLALPLNPYWSDGTRRLALKGAWESYRLRGTPRGLERLAKLYAGIDVGIVEHFRMRPLMLLGGTAARRLGRTSRLWSRDFYGRLQLDAYSRLGYFRLTNAPEPPLEALAWGAHRFSVFFVAEPATAAETLKRVRQVVEREKPAHTEAVYCPVLPRLRVGVQSTVGVDTRIGGITPVVLGRVATLGYDAVLACSSHENGVTAVGASPQPRAGVSTRLQ
jgi:phage tail-like protein